MLRLESGAFSSAGLGQGCYFKGTLSLPQASSSGPWVLGDAAAGSQGTPFFYLGSSLLTPEGPVCATDCVVKAAVDGDGGLGFFHVLVIKQPLHLLPRAWNELLYGKPIIYRHWSLPLLF